MHYRNRDIMIERYLSGTMSPDEERAFLRRLAADRALRRSVDAERAIRRTLIRDRNALPREDPSVRAHVMTLLGVMAPAVEQTVSTAAASTATTTAASSGAATQGASLLAGGIAKGIAITLAGAALTVGAFLATHSPGSRAVSHPPASVRSVEPAAIPAPALPAAVEADVEQKSDAADVQQKPAPPTSLPGVARRSVSHTRVAASPAQVAARPVESTPMETRQHVDPIPSQQESSPRHIVVADSMPVQVTVDLGKLKR